MAVSNPDGPKGRKVTKTVTLNETDLKAATRLFRMLAEPLPLGDASAVTSRNVEQDRQLLLAKARAVFDGRRLRERFFDSDMFGEPAWDILLLLYIAEQSGARLTTSRLAEQVACPLTTVGRWLGHLETQHYIDRHAHPTDKRIAFIALLPKARQKLSEFLASLPD